MAKNKSKEKVTVLAFEKKLIPSDGYFYGTTWDNSSQLVPLKLREKAVRGTISNRLKMTTEKDYLGLDAKVENANLQTVDTCSLSQEQDTLVVKFSLKVIGGLEKPSACNNSNFLSSYKEAVKKYKETYGFSELASRYALNIANGRFLWRNRVGVENILVTVELENKGLDTIYEFDSNSIGLDNFEYSTNEIASLAQHIEKVLLSSDDYLLMKITCKARLGLAQEVYPSEELVLDSNSKKKDKKSKILYSIDGIAAMHSQKIGNALRSIDTWYLEFDDVEETAGAIAIEPYGAVTNLGRAYRNPKSKKDFFSLFDKFAWGEELDSIEDYHYVMAVLIRGGVFGEGDK
jgi:CRISPR-associated protein Csy3